MSLATPTPFEGKAIYLFIYIYIYTELRIVEHGFDTFARCCAAKQMFQDLVHKMFMFSKGKKRLITCEDCFL